MAMKSLTGFDANNQRIINVADPTSNTDGANKQYVDNVAAGLNWKQNVRAASTANVTVSSPGTTLDGVTLAANDRILLKDQTTGSENGIYVWTASGSALTRATDADTSAEIKNAAVRISEGTVNADKMYQMITDSVTLGTTSLVWTIFGGGTTYSADGNGIELSSTTFSIELDGSSLSKSSAGLRIGTAAAANGLTIDAGGLLSVGAGTGISVGADTVGIDTSVVVRKFAANCAATTNPQTFNHALNNADVLVQVTEVSTKKVVLADVTLTDANNVSVDFGGAPSASQYRVEIVG
jgi:hypothetical protein